jgi:hypothetical protein
VTTTNERTSQNVGLLFKTAWEIMFGYNKGYSQFSGITKSNFETDALIVDTDNFLNYGPKFEYENLKNTNNNKSNFDIVNTSLRYQKNSAFGFELSKLLDNKIKNDYSFSGLFD